MFTLHVTLNHSKRCNKS